tara:strand:- start:56 stop:1468 length:1413 start_codon:yes stop_codon:yes gene_type:complete
MEPVSLLGKFWLPEMQSDFRFGQISIDSERNLTLNIVGTFRSRAELGSAGDLGPDVLHGETNDGSLCTLIGVSENGFNFKLGSQVKAQNSSYSIAYLIQGDHIRSLDEPIFQETRFAFEDLDEWVNIDGFTTNSHPTQPKIELRYSLPDPISLSIEDGFLDLEFSFQTKSPSTVEKVWQQRSNFRLALTGPCSIRNILDGYMYPIQHLVAFGIGKPTFPSTVQLSRERIIPGNKPHNSSIQWLQLIYSPSGYLSDRKRPNRYSMLFGLPAILSYSETVFKNWFSNYTALRPVFNLYFSCLYQSEMYVEQLLLSFCHAIEVYHRLKNPQSTFVEPKSFENEVLPALTAAIPTNLDQDFRRKIQDTLKYLNEYSLRRRLKDICKENDEVLLQVIPEPKRFVNSVVNTRNYFTHYNPQQHDANMTTREIFMMARRLRFLLEVMLLRELHIPENEIQLLVKNYPGYDFLRRELP